LGDSDISHKRSPFISLLAQQEFCVIDQIAALEIEQATLSHQLRDLRAQQLVVYRREGRHAFYRLDDPHVHGLFEQGLAHVEEL
jgi:DNA-binding transcriptional ArsR family regulator